MDGLDQIRATIGPVEHSGISDEEIKNTLYHFYYDVAQSLNWILGESWNRPTSAELIRLQRIWLASMRLRSAEVSGLLLHLLSPSLVLLQSIISHHIMTAREAVWRSEGACP